MNNKNKNLLQRIVKCLKRQIFLQPPSPFFKLSVRPEELTASMDITIKAIGTM
jgi:hypothetical protein